MKNVFIIGSKGIPANYGGFETFVEQLTKNKKNENIKYHVSCISNNNDVFEYNNARCFNVRVANIGAAKAVYYDIKALSKSIKYIKENKIENAIIYVLACRIGPFISHYKKQIKKLGAKLYVNPDGHEWKRAKWNFLIKKYWKISEQYMVKHADLLICDSINIEKYIKEDYKQYKPTTTFIAYGANIPKKTKATNELKDWYEKNNISKDNYYLVVGRFVPENNYETMIKEYMKSNTTKDLVLITNIDKNNFYDELKEKTHFDQDSRIKFVGTVYNQELLTMIRQNAYGYLHGHEVGGTNPSLLEALATTKLNLLLDVGFNKEVGKTSSLYWNKKTNNLSKLLNKCDKLSKTDIKTYDTESTNIIKKEYTWDKIVDSYENCFLGDNND